MAYALVAERKGNKMFEEISVKEISGYKDAVSLFEEGGIAYAKGKERENGLTIAWGGLGVLWRKPCLSVYVHATRFSKKIFDEADSFSVCFFSKDKQAIVNYFGSHSGRDEDKAKAINANIIHDEDAPYFEDAELVIICKKMGQSDFDPSFVDEGVKDWYSKQGVHTIYQGQIIKVLRKKQ